MLKKKTNGIELTRGRSVFETDLLLSETITSKQGVKVAMFGGAYIAQDSEYYSKAELFAKEIADSGISVITGGGSGIMEAGNKGASSSSNKEALSYGLKVSSIKDEVQANNSYISEETDYTFDTLSVRLLTLISVSDAIVFFPGGFGTFEELFSLLVRIKVNMMKQIPIYMIGKKYWEGLFAWLSSTVVSEKAISLQNLSLVTIEDDVGKVAKEIIEKFK